MLPHEPHRLSLRCTPTAQATEGAGVSERPPPLPEDEAPLEPTADDERVWAEVYGFTPREIGIMARAVDVPEDKVTRLIELARFKP